MQESQGCTSIQQEPISHASCNLLAMIWMMQDCRPSLDCSGGASGGGVKLIGDSERSGRKSLLCRELVRVVLARRKETSGAVQLGTMYGCGCKFGQHRFSETDLRVRKRTRPAGVAGENWYKRLNCQANIHRVDGVAVVSTTSYLNGSATSG